MVSLKPICQLLACIFASRKGRLANKGRTACGQMIARREAQDFTGLARDVDFQRLAHFISVRPE